MRYRWIQVPARKVASLRKDLIHYGITAALAVTKVLQPPYRGLGGSVIPLDREIHGDEDVLGPVQRARGHAIMLHQKVPLPLVFRHPPLDKLERAALDFMTDFVFVRSRELPPIQLRPQFPVCVSMAAEP
jgi:hypothetical protein